MTRQRPNFLRRERRADPHAMARCLARVSEQPEENAIAVLVVVMSAWERLRTGAGITDNYETVASALNVALMRAERISPLLVSVVNRGCDALRACAEIHERHGRYGFTGPGLEAMRDALEVYEEILRKSTPGQMEAAVDEAERRHRELSAETTA